LKQQKELIEKFIDIKDRLAANGTTAVKFGEISEYLSKNQNNN
jgi:hypothetical protein